MPRNSRFDVVVAGAGPAGIAAACAAAESGCRVAVIDDNPSAGGQIWRGKAATRQAAQWMERFRSSGAELFVGTCIVDHPAAGALVTESAGEFAYGKLIIATGARERFLPFPGWTLPNVTGAGGLQALAKGGLELAGKVVVVAGSGPLVPAVAAYLVKRGARIPLIAEQAPWRRVARFGLSLAADPSKLAQAVDLMWSLRGIKYLRGCWPVAAEGRDRLEAVVLEKNGRRWREPCDYLACGFGLVPNLELALLAGCETRDGAVTVDEWQQTSERGIYAAGETTGVGGVDLALAGGAVAGYHAAGRSEDARAWFGRRAGAAAFKKHLDRTFSLRDELRPLAADETTVCRCEDVTLGRIREQHSWRSAKLQTRCGMGPCQARVCGPAVEFLLGWKVESTRPPVFPASVGRLAGAQRLGSEGGNF